MRRCTLIVAAAGSLLITRAADAQEASFDCLQATHPIEWLICSDPVLMQLDGALGEAYAAYRRSLPSDEARQVLLREQRVWLQRRLTECGIPASGTRLSLPQRWQVAPCLAQMYNNRLAALGQPQEASFQPEEVIGSKDFVHPLCLELALGQPTSRDDANDLTPVSVPVKACNEGNRHIPIEAGADGLRASEGASVGVRTWLGYRVLGRLPDGREFVHVNYASGGTGHFSEIAEIRRTPLAEAGDQRLTARTLIDGGDRCSLGIAQAELVGEETLAVDFHATLADFLAAAEPEQSGTPYYQQLPACAVCCFATVRYNFSVTGGAGNLVSATIMELESAEATQEDDPMLHCVEKRVQAMAGSFPHTFSADELRVLVRDVQETCSLDADPGEESDQ